MRRNKMCAFILALALIVFGVAPAMANWAQPGNNAAFPVTTIRPGNEIITTFSAKPDASDLKVALATQVIAATDTTGKVSAAVVTAYLAHRTITASHTQRLPLFQVISNDQTSAKDIVVMHPLDSEFNGKTPSQLTVVKIYGTANDQNKLYTNVYAAADVKATNAAGTFAVLGADGKTVIGASTAIPSGSFVALCIAAASDTFNVGKTNLIDPAFVYMTATLIPVTGVTVSPTSVTLVPGGNATLTATVAPSGATDPSIVWASSNTAVATVSEVTGTTAKVTVPGTASVGSTATVTVTTTDGTKTASCVITVGVPVTGVTVAPSSATIGVGGTVALMETVAPATATNKAVTWSSSDTSVATVSTTGVVTGKSAGTATITVTTTEGAKTATSAITVVSGPQPEIPGFLHLLPSGVEDPSLITVPGTVFESGLNPAAGDTVEQVSATSSYANYLVLKNSVISNILSHRGNSMNSQIAIKMPVFKAVVSAAGKTGVVMFKLPSSSLAGYKAGAVVPVKAISTSASEALTYAFVASASKLADGKFGIVTSDRTTFMGAEELLESGSTYYIVFAIKDGGRFDMNSSDMYITDPTFVGVSTGHSGGGGGCNTGAFVPAALLLVLPLLAILRKRG